MALRPSQLRARAAESALMLPAAFALYKDYAVLTMPVPIVAGGDDEGLTQTTLGSASPGNSQTTLREVSGDRHIVHQSPRGGDDGDRRTSRQRSFARRTADGDEETAANRILASRPSRQVGEVDGVGREQNARAYARVRQETRRQ